MKCHKTLIYVPQIPTCVVLIKDDIVCLILNQICWKLQQIPCTDLCSLQHLITHNCLWVLTQIVPARAFWLLIAFSPSVESLLFLLHWLQNAVW